MITLAPAMVYKKRPGSRRGNMFRPAFRHARASGCASEGLRVATRSRGPLGNAIDNLLSMRSSRNFQSLEKPSHLLAQVVIMLVDGTPVVGWTTCLPLARQDRLQHLVPENAHRNHGLQAIGWCLVAMGFPLSIDQFLAAQLSEVIGGMTGLIALLVRVTLQFADFAGHIAAGDSFRLHCQSPHRLHNRYHPRLGNVPPSVAARAQLGRTGP